MEEVRGVLQNNRLRLLQSKLDVGNYHEEWYPWKDKASMRIF